MKEEVTSSEGAEAVKELEVDPNKISISKTQAEKAQAAAERVVQFIDGIESQMGWTTRAEWSRVGLDQRRYDFIRLLRQEAKARRVSESGAQP
jgi:hypothetical protein